MAKMLKALLSAASLVLLLGLGFLLAGLNYHAFAYYLLGVVGIITGAVVFGAGYWKGSKDTNLPSPKTPPSWTGTERRTAART